jgi:dual specificity MAP kinase phosphatase
MQQNKINPHAKVNFSQITDSIFLGTDFCCRVHFDEYLLKKGVTTDISLEEEKIDTPYGVNIYLWLPVKDHFAPTMYQFKTGISVMDTAIKNKNKIYVHCKNGHGRSPTLVAAYLITQGMSSEEAIEKIKEKRPEIHVRDSQIEALKKFKDELNLK